MRVPTYVQFQNQLNSMTNQSNTLNNMSQQINTGLKLNHASDDPILAQQIKTTQDYIDQISAYTSNTTDATNRADLAESSVTGSIGTVQRITTLIKAAQTDTASATDRKNIATELQGLLNQLTSYANVSDVNGDYIFSGTSTTTIPFSNVNGVVTYVGSQEASTLDISPSINQVYGDTGQNVFGNIRLGNGSFTSSQGSTPNVGTGVASVGAITNQAAYVQDTYTITFVTNGASQIGYQVVGANSGQVIPAPPATTPTDAPQYISGENINFNGLSLSISGAPAVNDAFVVAPSLNQNAMQTINQLISVIGMDINNPVDKANYDQQLTQLSASVDQVKSHLNNYLSEIGYRSSTANTVTLSNQKTVDTESIVLGNLSNADLSQLVPQYKLQMINLDLTMKSYTELENLFSQILKSNF